MKCRREVIAAVFSRTQTTTMRPLVHPLGLESNIARQHRSICTIHATNKDKVRPCPGATCDTNQKSRARSMHRDVHPTRCATTAFDSAHSRRGRPALPRKICALQSECKHSQRIHTAGAPEPNGQADSRSIARLTWRNNRAASVMSAPASPTRAQSASLQSSSLGQLNSRPLLSAAPKDVVCLVCRAQCARDQNAGLT